MKREVVSDKRQSGYFSQQNTPGKINKFLRRLPISLLGVAHNDIITVHWASSFQILPLLILTVIVEIRFKHGTMQPLLPSTITITKAMYSFYNV